MRTNIEVNNSAIRANKFRVANFFTTCIKGYLHDEGALAKAFNKRKSIYFDGIKQELFTTSNEVKTSLNNIMQKKKGYTYDNEARNTFNAMGYTDEQILYINVDEILKYDAILFLAHAEVFEMIENIYPLISDESEFAKIQNRKCGEEKNYFKAELTAIAAQKIMSLLSPHIALRQALQELRNSVSDIANPHSTLKGAGKAVLDTAQSVISDDLPLNQLTQLAEFVSETSKVVENPTNKNVRNYTNQVQKATDIGMDFPWVKALGGAMLAFLGIALIITAILVAVATFGGATPLSMLAFPLGGNLLFAGIALAATTVTGGLATAIGGFFIVCSKTENLAGTMEGVTKTPEFKAAISQINDNDKLEQPRKLQL